MERRRVALIAAGILALALALRVGHVVSQRGDVLFDHPALDEHEYVQNARALAAGHGEDRPYWQPPGLVYVLAATFEVAGPGLFAPRLLQAIVSVASCLLLFVIARRLFDERAALAAMAIAAVHGVLIFECGELLPATWIVFFDLLALWLVLRALASRRIRDAAAAGLALGVAATFAPTIAPFVAIVAVMLRKPALAAALVVATLVPIVPITMRNLRHGGEFVVISTNGGLNLHIGNNADYDKTFAMRPGRHWEELTTEPEREHITAPGASSTYFAKQAAGFALHHPISEAGLLARKLYLFCNGAEIPRDSDIYEARASSPVLAVVIGPRPSDLPDGLLIPAALLGIAMLWRDRRRLAAPLWLLATIAASCVVFFVASRHRAPALPLFALFAAGGWRPLLEQCRRHTWLRVAVGVLVVVLNIPTWETAQSYAGEADFYRGLAALEMRHVDAAKAAFTRATEQNPHDARAWFELGNLSSGNAAIGAWLHAAAADPWDDRAARRVAQALTQAGDLEGATQALEASIASHAREPAHYAPDHLNLAFMEARLGKVDQALAHLAAARVADPDYFRATLPRMAKAAHADPAMSPAFLAALDGGRR